MRDAQARAVLAKQILRGVHYAVTAAKFIEQQARLAPPAAGADDGSPIKSGMTEEG
ncbi:MAG: hypothetical protein AB7R90_22065 [Reyranellaceae bacterium]